MDGQHPTPVGKLQVYERGNVLHAGVGDEHVDSGEPCGDLRDALVDLFFVGDVHGDAHGVGTQRFRRLLRALHVGDGDAGALLEEPFGDGAAQPARRAGDDGDLAFQSHKGLLSTRDSSPKMPRRNASTQMTKIAPSVTVTQDPSCAR